MRSRSIVVPAASLALAALLAACSSGSSSTPNASGSAGIASPGSASAPATSGSAAGSGAAGSPSTTASSPAAPGGSASAQIKTNWEAFFSGKTSASQKVALLQNGQQFSQAISAQAGSSLAQSAGAQVTNVVVTGETAKVTYNITLAGKPALSGQQGTAVYEGGAWKVGDASFCALLTLENGGTPPSVCKSVSG